MSTLYEFGAYRLDPEKRLVTSSGGAVPLAPKTFDLLLLLVESQGRALSKSELMRSLWPDTFVEEANLSFQVSTLRKALGEEGAKWIETLPKHGYRFGGEVIQNTLPDRSEKLATVERVGGVRPATAKRKYQLFAIAAVLALGLAAGLGRWLKGPSRAASTAAVHASVAVMPFINQSADPGSEYFSDGMTDELISGLSRVEGLKVVARSSVFRYKGKDYDIKELGEQLGVRTVLEGTVRKAGTRLRVSAQLTDASNGFNLWSQTFDGEIRDVFDVQEEVCRAIVETFQVRLRGGSEQPLVERYTNNWEAYDLYLRGRYHYWRVTEKDFKASLDYYERAKQLDPRYPLPYVGVAAYYATIANIGDAPPRESLAKAEQELEQALALNPTIPLAYSYRGYIRRGQLRWREAETACRRAIELDPRLAHGYKIYAQLLGETGRSDEAIAMAKRAVELEPATGNNRYILGWAFIVARQYERAVEEGRGAISADANNILGYIVIGNALLEQNRFPEAIESLEQARRLGPNMAFVAGFLGNAYGRAGKREQAQDLLDELLERRKNGYVPGVWIALVYAGLGDDDAMFRWLETAYRDYDPALGNLKVGPNFDPYRSDPRFQDLVKRIGFPE